jgi:hypothetical protein
MNNNTTPFVYYCTGMSENEKRKKVLSFKINPSLMQLVGFFRNKKRERERERK